MDPWNDHGNAGTDAECEECGKRLGPPQARYYDGAYISCWECRAVYSVSADSEGMCVAFVGAPCGYCGRLTDDGGPCEAPCEEENLHRVRLEEAQHADL